MKSINDQYNDILKKCKFISKPDEWYVEGTEAKLEGRFLPSSPQQAGNPMNHKLFNDGSGLFYGLTNETFEGYTGELPREDGEICSFDEFYIYDEFGNEISELTLEEYKKFIRKKKLEQLND